MTERTFKEIEIYSKRSNKGHLYPRPDLIILNRYLNDTAIHRSVAESPSAIPANSGESVTDNFAVIHDIRAGDGICFEGSLKELVDFGAYDSPSTSLLLFLRGSASPQWLAAVEGLYRASPELYWRHLDFQTFASGARDLYTPPVLPGA